MAKNTGVADLSEALKNEMQRSLRRITSAFCRCFFVAFFFYECSTETVYVLGARGILSIVERRYWNFLLLNCNRSFSKNNLSLSLSMLYYALRKMMDILSDFYRCLRTLYFYGISIREISFYCIH